MVDKDLLKIELSVFYSRNEITAHSIANQNIFGCLHTLNFIINYGLDTAFREILKVLKILVTIPMTTAETKRSFSKTNVASTQ